MEKCPICKVVLSGDSYYDSDIHATVEEYEICRNGCGQYGYEYAYGNWIMELGGTRLTGGHGDSKTRRKKIDFIYKRRLTQLRKAHRKKKRRGGI